MCINFRYIRVIFILFFLSSCGEQKKENVVDLLQKWSGKEILFPANLTFTVQYEDTIDFPILGKYKILTYVDSIGCISCKLQLGQWKAFMESINNAEMETVRFFFFFSPERRKDFLNTLKSEDFTYPICIDDENKLNELNHFPSKGAAFHTFLLDKDNRILAIGNPIHNPKVKELYLKIIQGEKVEKDKGTEVINTKVTMDKTSISLGRFNWQKEQKATFTLKNTGNRPLAVQDVNTSCGCTSVSYSKEPVQPGGELKLEVIYTAEHPEHFNKTITVYCNMESSPLVLKIMRDAE